MLLCAAYAITRAMSARRHDGTLVAWRRFAAKERRCYAQRYALRADIKSVAAPRAHTADTARMLIMLLMPCLQRRRE